MNLLCRSLLLLFLAPNALAGTVPGAEPATAPSPTPTAAPEAAPAIPTLVVETLDGETWDLSQRRGRWVVVNFWATWCKPCIKEIPDLSALDTRRDDLEVIGLAYEDTSLEDLRAFLTQHPAAYPIARVDVYAPPADFDTPRGLPMTYLIAPEGQVVRRFLGPVTGQDIEQAIEVHVGASAPAG